MPRRQVRLSQNAAGSSDKGTARDSSTSLGMTRGESRFFGSSRHRRTTISRGIHRSRRWCAMQGSMRASLAFLLFLRSQTRAQDAGVTSESDVALRAEQSTNASVVATVKQDEPWPEWGSRLNILTFSHRGPARIDRCQTTIIAFRIRPMRNQALHRASATVGAACSRGTVLDHRADQRGQRSESGRRKRFH